MTTQRLLPGGESLVRLLNFRLARPACLIDTNLLSEVDYLEVGGELLRVGALTYQARLEPAARVPLLVEAVAGSGTSR